MNKPSRLIEWIVWGGLALIVAGIAVAFVRSEAKPKFNFDLPVIGQVKDFALTNQLNQPVSLSHLAGKIWVGNVIFTRCPGPCAKLTREMAQLQKLLPKDPTVQLVTLTADPDFDTPKVLQAYGKNFGADETNWMLLTGPKPVLYRLAINDLLLAVSEKPVNEREFDNDLFVHSTKFVLVDKHGRIRGVFEGTDPVAKDGIVLAVQKLLKEE